MTLFSRSPTQSMWGIILCWFCLPTLDRWLYSIFIISSILRVLLFFFFKWVFVIESFSSSAAKTSLHSIFTENQQENQPNYWITTLPKNPNVNFHWLLCNLSQGCLQDFPYWALAIIYLGQLHSLLSSLSSFFYVAALSLQNYARAPFFQISPHKWYLFSQL